MPDSPDGRLVDPPLSELHRLTTPLTEGERALLNLLHRSLPIEWEFYIQPHLNGLRPDLVLLNPSVGIAVFEVKDWDFEAMDYFAERDCSTNQLRLMAQDKSGKRFSRERDNPVTKIRLYKRELFDLYCPRLDDRAGIAAITGGLVFTKARREPVEKAIAPFRMADEGLQKYPQYYPLATSEDLASGNIAAIFPEHWRRTSKVMSADIADDLRAWLKEPAFSKEQRLPLELDSRQRDLATTRTESGYRRIKGPAGSGKSVVLAARAAELADLGKRVLVVTYNITLLNYLRDLTVRHASTRGVVRRQVDFLNFHLWCKRVCDAAGAEAEYRSLWATSRDDSELDAEPILKVKLALLVQGLYARPDLRDVLPTYDAILVDEGQDYVPEWWKTLRAASAPGGELILVADKTQNIYSTASAWTEEEMSNSGFRGPWAELQVSYRLPPAVIPLLQEFSKQFLADEEVDLPQSERRPDQLDFTDLFPVELRWVQVSDPNKAIASCVAELRRQMTRLRRDTAIPDITFLSGTAIGRAVVDDLTSNRVHVLHTFDSDKSVARRQKRAFFQGAAQVKATTLHSFKGWEARHLVLFVGSMQSREDRALLYTAMTRLRRHANGSVLTVVSTCPELYSFGQKWPEFVQA